MIQRFVNPLLDKRAIAVIGVKFGGWGINRENMAIKIIDTNKKFPKKKQNKPSNRLNVEKKQKFKKILFDSVSEYFKIFEFYETNFQSKDSESIFEADLEKFSK